MKRIRLAVLLIALLILLVSCIKPGVNTANIDDGFNKLKSGELTVAEAIFNDCLSKSKDPVYKSRASEGLGWVQYLREDLNGAEVKFGAAIDFNLQNNAAKSGLTITLARKSEWTEAVSTGQGLLQSEDFSINYLPSILYREEIVKLLAVSALITGNATVLEEAVLNISDTSFVNRLDLLGGE